MNEITTDLLTELGEKYQTPKIADLYSWSMLYKFGQRPLDAFLDLIGIYADEMGDLRFYQPKPDEAGFGNAELGYIGEALVEYSEKAQRVEAFIEAVDQVEAETEMVRVPVTQTYTTPAPIPAVEVLAKENPFASKCGECGRVFDLLDNNARNEWQFGHDCEA